MYSRHDSIVAASRSGGRRSKSPGRLGEGEPNERETKATSTLWSDGGDARRLAGEKRTASTIRSEDHPLPTTTSASIISPVSSRGYDTVSPTTTTSPWGIQSPGSAFSDEDQSSNGSFRVVGSRAFWRERQGERTRWRIAPLQSAMTRCFSRISARGRGKQGPCGH